jgi:hypothetical protein
VRVAGEADVEVDYGVDRDSRYTRLLKRARSRSEARARIFGDGEEYRGKPWEWRSSYEEDRNDRGTSQTSTNDYVSTAHI